MLEMWFLILSAALGLAIGSFLNVVIYRLPRELSVSQPRRSFCPRCGADIAWHDNIPVLSWLVLRGRCRNCREPISIQYPLIELLTAIVFVAVFDALMIGRVDPTIAGRAADAIPLAAYWALFASLLANAVIDLEQYIIDVRLTFFAMIVGVVASAASVAVSSSTPLPDMQLGIAALAMGLGWAVTAFIASRVVADEQAERHEDTPVAANATDGAPVATEEAPIAIAPATPETDALGTATSQTPETAQPPDAAIPENAPAPQAPPSWLGQAIPILALALVFCGLAVAPFVSEAGGAAFAARAITTLSVLCFVLILAAMQPRASDDEMVAIIEDERPRARRVALRELAWLTPAIVLGVAAYGYIGQLAPAPPAVHIAHRYFQPPPEPPGWSLVWGATPPWYGRALAGALGGLTGLMGGAALGWGVRIFFTLVFGKEAYGTGDIYLMAAIGAVGGFWMCLIAFFAASLLALFGVVACLLRKSCRALPFGPWLAMGALVALWVRTPVVARMQPALETLWRMVTGRPLGEL